MFAVVRTGGKQYRVAPGDVIQVEKLAGEAGETITLDDILMVNDGKTTMLGTPVVKGASVTAEIVAQARADKILVFKKKRRKHYRRLNGHRQEVTVLRISAINGAGKGKAAAGGSKAEADTPAEAGAADGKES
ncbi:MAG: 50S ribosomal protein L21 [Alphaproteobacteria bacterium]